MSRRIDDFQFVVLAGIQMRRKLVNRPLGDRIDLRLMLPAQAHQLSVRLSKDTLQFAPLRRREVQPAVEMVDQHVSHHLWAAMHHRTNPLTYKKSGHGNLDS